MNRLPGRNHKRADAAYMQDFGEESDTVRKLPCLVAGCDRCPCEPAHVKSRGAGGGRFDIVPLCTAHHREQHDHGIKTFAAKYSLDLRADADAIAVMHSEPLGIRGLARRWAVNSLSDVLDTYERGALFGWVRRAMDTARTQGRASTRPGWALYILAELRLDDNAHAWALCEAAGWPS